MSNGNIKYPDYVKQVVFIGNKKEKIRYGLEIYLDNDGFKEALVILKNPSKADEYEGDTTICNWVLKTLNRLKYKKIVIANIIPYYATDSSSLNANEDVFNKSDVYEYNKSYIKSIIDDSVDIFVGWGTDNDSLDEEFYKQRILDIESLIKQKCYCSGINKDYTPKHPLYSWNNSFNDLRDFDAYYVI